jgi:hypothetical protein
MDGGWWIALLVIAAAATIFFWPAWFKAHVRRKRAADPGYSRAAGLGVFDEIWHPHANKASHILEIEKEVPAPPPLPGDPPRQP